MLQKLFGFDPTQNKVRTEIYAGITTFLTMAYILAVNPGIFSALEPYGMPTGAVFTATVLASVVGTLMMAFYAKKPFGLAPGMGINAFFVFTVCLGMGYSWQFALTAVFIEGILFIILSLFKMYARDPCQLQQSLDHPSTYRTRGLRTAGGEKRSWRTALGHPSDRIYRNADGRDTFRPNLFCATIDNPYLPTV